MKVSKKSIRYLKWSDKNIWWRLTSANEAIQIVSEQGIKDPDIIVNLVWLWANTYISGYATHNSVGMVVDNS